LDLLAQLQTIPGPSGDEGRIADFVAAWAGALEGVRVERVQDLVVATRGTPAVAVFAHLDTIGFTQGYDRTLIPIGGPKVEGGERLRNVETGAENEVELRAGCGRGGPAARLRRKGGQPGDRLVYADPLRFRRDTVRGPYLDNRAGVWNALRVLERVPDVAVVFSPGEEHSGCGAAVGARLVFDLGVRRALISDITWHTRSIRVGKGPAISLRDRYVPRQAYLRRVLALAEASGLPFQREVESEGGSDGGVIERSHLPLDWLFIGAPEKRPHTPRELCRISDLHAMTDLYAALILALSREEACAP
jgi:putative aminopeptidase FrvX